MDVGLCGVIVEIPLCKNLNSNIGPLRARQWTVSGRQFDWGGRLLKSNGGVQRFPQVGRKSTVECNSKRELDCETNTSSRCESRI